LQIHLSRSAIFSRSDSCRVRSQIYSRFTEDLKYLTSSHHLLTIKAMIKSNPIAQTTKPQQQTHLPLKDFGNPSIPTKTMDIRDII